MSSNNRHRVVITGMGALTNVGHNAADTWDAMKSGRSGIKTIDSPEFDQYNDWTVTIGGQVRDWTPDAIMDKREAKRVDRVSLLGLAAAQEAVDHSGMDFTTGDPERRGIVMGSGIGGIYTIETSVQILENKGPSRISPFTVPKLMANAVTGNISIRFNLQGYASTHATACASSGHAIADAMEAIRSGKADVMIAGGAEAALTPLCLGAFMTMKALSTRNDAPEKASRPFDIDRDGFILSEGAAVYVLESLEHAQARGATIYAELCGAANSCDAGHITAPHPEGRGATNAMKWALKDAGMDPTSINYINAHGTSTPLGDKAEIIAVKNVFGEHATGTGGLVMNSTKSMHGHCLGASGAVELIACIHAVTDGIVAPTINLDNIDPECSGVDIVANTAREMSVNYAMNNTFGFGGHNVSLIVGRFDG